MRDSESSALFFHWILHSKQILFTAKCAFRRFMARFNDLVSIRNDTKHRDSLISWKRNKRRSWTKTFVKNFKARETTPLKLEPCTHFPSISSPPWKRIQRRLGSLPYLRVFVNSVHSSRTMSEEKYPRYVKSNDFTLNYTRSSLEVIRYLPMECAASIDCFRSKSRIFESLNS